jgi:small-conductance mechanosensitive channel
MDYILNSLRADWQTMLAYSPRLIYAVALVVVFEITGRIVGKVVGRVLRNSERFNANERFLRRITTWVIRLAGILLALGVLGFKGVVASLLATGGVVAIVLGFAFREIGENLLAGLFLTFSRPFELGDMVKTGDLTGTVRAIDIRSVHIRTFDACDVFVPSAQIFRQELYNYTRDGLRRQNFKIGVAYHDEPEQVINLLKDTTRGVRDVLKDPGVTVTVADFADSFIVYEVFFFLDIEKASRGIADLSNDVKVRCWRALKDAGMTFSTDVSTAIDLKTFTPLKVEESADPERS